MFKFKYIDMSFREWTEGILFGAATAIAATILALVLVALVLYSINLVF